MSIKPMQLPARVFKRKVIAVMNPAKNVNRSASISWQVVTPQLMGRAVRRQHD